MPVFDLVGDTKVKNLKNVASLLADNGVEPILTGHMHIQSINEFYSQNGNRLIDICTACLVGSPAKYRKITVDSSSVLKVESIPVNGFDEKMNAEETKEFFDNKFAEAIITRIDRSLAPGKGVAGKLKGMGRSVFRKIKVGTLGCS